MSVGCGRAAENGARPPRAVSGDVVTTPANPDPGQRWTHPSDGLAYVWIPPGSFQMGCVPGDPECGDDEGPRHPVTLSRGYRLGQTEVREVRGGSWSYYTRLLPAGWVLWAR